MHSWWLQNIHTNTKNTENIFHKIWLLQKNMNEMSTTESLVSIFRIEVIARVCVCIAYGVFFKVRQQNDHICYQNERKRLFCR